MKVAPKLGGPEAARGGSACLEPENVIFGVEYTCADGSKRKGVFLSGPLASCAKDGETGCVATTDFPAVEKSRLTPGVLKLGVSVAGVSGAYPSVGFPLEGADPTVEDLSGLTSALSAGTYEFFDSSGVRRIGQIVDYGEVTPGLAAQSVTPAAGLMRSLVVKGDANLLGANIKDGISLFGVAGGFSDAPVTCTSDGQTGCLASASHPAARASGLADKVVSGETVAGVSGNVTLPAASAVRAGASFGVNGATSGTLVDCALDGSTNCVSTAGFPAVNFSLLSPGVLKKDVVLAGVTGDYPSVSYPLAGASGTTDLTSLDATLPAGTYEFFDSQGTRYSGAVSDVGTLSIGTSPQTFDASLYRGFSVPGDANLVPSNVSTGVSILGVTGSALLRPDNCSADGQSNCVVDDGTSYRAASTTGLASKVRSGESVAGVSGNVTLPLASNVLSGVNYGANGTSLSGAVANCSADGATNCYVPSSGAIKAADTTHFNGWDIRKKRNPSTGAVYTFAGLAGQNKTCRNRARTALWDNVSGGTSPSTDSHSSHAVSGLDFFDTIDDYNGGSSVLPNQIPAWSMINSTNYGSDFACGGIFATGEVATGSTGADASLSHDPNGNWQDLTPGILPNATNSTNTANGCNASDKHCVFRELISGLMVTERSPTTYTWANAINYCHTLGEPGGAVENPIPVIGGAAYSDWRLPTQKELMHLYHAGIRGLNETGDLLSFFGSMSGTFWTSSSPSTTTGNAWNVDLGYGQVNIAAKAGSTRSICVR